LIAGAVVTGIVIVFRAYEQVLEKQVLIEDSKSEQELAKAAATVVEECDAIAASRVEDWVEDAGFWWNVLTFGPFSYADANTQARKYDKYYEECTEDFGAS
jgi:hypothetical protein